MGRKMEILCRGGPLCAEVGGAGPREISMGHVLGGEHVWKSRDYKRGVAHFILFIPYASILFMTQRKL